MKRESLIDLSLFILRLVVGTVFALHGAQKLFGMFGGIGIEGTTKMMEGLGFTSPYLMAWIWSGVEFIGGMFLVLGFLSRYAAALIVVVMLVSIWKIDLVYGFFIQNGGFEYDLLIIGACMPLILMGGGSWSVWDV